MNINMLWVNNISSRLLIIIVIGFIFTQPVNANEVYSFGIVPQQSSSKLARTWGPILKYLETQTGYKFQFTTAKNIPTFENALANGRYDFAYMNPYHYVIFHKRSGYKAFAKAKGKQIHGIIVVHKNSKITSIKQLHNKELAFPSPLAFAASMLTRSKLKHKNIDITPRYVSSHDSVYRNVAAKNFVAGGGVIRTFQSAVPEISNQLRILYKTSGYTPHAFAQHPRVPNKVKDTIIKAMLNMDSNPVGKQLLKTLKIKDIARATSRDYDDVRKIRF